MENLDLKLNFDKLRKIFKKMSWVASPALASSLSIEGQVISQGARVIEVDRKTKRITVSLQSTIRQEDELASIAARKKRQEKHLQRKDNNKSNNKKLEPNQGVPSPQQLQHHHSVTPKENSANGFHSNHSFQNNSEHNSRGNHHQGRMSGLSIPTTTSNHHDVPRTEPPVVGQKQPYDDTQKPESEMTPAELKRARKIARRAARRAAQ